MEHLTEYFDYPGVGQLFFQSWLPEGDPRAVVLVVHGLAEHGGRYANVVNQLVPAGYAVVALDLYGHGQSEGLRVFVRRFEDFTGPIEHLRQEIGSRFPEKKVFLLGHSMGGLVAACHLLDTPDLYVGAVLSGPLVAVPSNISAATVAIAKALSALLPRLPLEKVNANGISRDPAVVQAYIDDPLVHTGGTTARLGAEMIKAMQRLTAGRGLIRLPILVLHGGEDLLVDPAIGREFFENLGSEDKTYLEYPDYYHEVYNDFGKEKPLADLQAWLDARA